MNTISRKYTILQGVLLSILTFRKFCKQHSKLFLKCHSKHFFKIYYNKLGPQQPIAAFFNTSQLSISMLDPMLYILISLDIIFFTLSSI